MRSLAIGFTDKERRSRDILSHEMKEERASNLNSVLEIRGENNSFFLHTDNTAALSGTVYMATVLKF